MKAASSSAPWREAVREIGGGVATSLSRSRRFDKDEARSFGIKDGWRYQVPRTMSAWVDILATDVCGGFASA